MAALAFRSHHVSGGIPESRQRFHSVGLQLHYLPAGRATDHRVRAIQDLGWRSKRSGGLSSIVDAQSQQQRQKNERRRSQERNLSPEMIIGESCPQRD